MIDLAHIIRRARAAAESGEYARAIELLEEAAKKPDVKARTKKTIITIITRLRAGDSFS